MVSSDSPLRILFFLFMAQGHILPLVDIAELFSARGVHTAIFTTPAIASDHPLVQLLTVPFPTTTSSSLPSGFEMFPLFKPPAMRYAFLQAVTDLSHPFNLCIKKFHPDSVVTNILLPWTYDTAAENNVPRIVFHVTNFFSRCCYDSLDRHRLAQTLLENRSAPRGVSLGAIHCTEGSNPSPLPSTADLIHTPTHHNRPHRALIHRRTCQICVGGGVDEISGADLEEWGGFERELGVLGEEEGEGRRGGWGDGVGEEGRGSERGREEAKGG